MLDLLDIKNNYNMNKEYLPIIEKLAGEDIYEYITYTSYGIFLLNKELTKAVKFEKHGHLYKMYIMDVTPGSYKEHNRNFDFLNKYGLNYSIQEAKSFLCP